MESDPLCTVVAKSWDTFLSRHHKAFLDHKTLFDFLHITNESSFYFTLEDDYNMWNDWKQKQIDSYAESPKDFEYTTTSLGKHNLEMDESSLDSAMNDSPPKKMKVDDAKNKGASNRELRNLLSSISPSQKKWPVQYEGQEELCEELDKVLTKLKSYSDHSYPFLNAVRKSDAPDYYDIIKQPMDLHKMTKKLNKCEYTSKSQFQADLNLIFQNCRTYNTDPSSKIYLSHADAMEKKAKELMKSVRNIEVNLDKKVQRHIPIPTSPGTERTLETPLDVKTKSKTKKKGASSSKGEKRHDLEQLGFSFGKQTSTVTDKTLFLSYRAEQRRMSFAYQNAAKRSAKHMASFLEGEKTFMFSNTFWPEISHVFDSIPEAQ